MADAMEIPEGYTVVKEGEAQILMQTSNTVFFNKAQVSLYIAPGVFYSYHGIPV
jgi:hypothetical protein